MDSTWLSQMRKGVLELCILAIVDREETYGYAVVERLGRIPGMEITESTVYPLLARLARDGMLIARVAPSPNGPARRYYRLSATGTRRLAELNNAWTTIVQGVAEVLEAAPSSRG
jgi:PadR family transcriptional regulator PadR